MIKNNVTRLLDSQGINYSIHQLPEVKLSAAQVAELLEKIQLVTVGEESLWFCIPPPQAAELLEKVQLVTVGEE